MVPERIKKKGHLFSGPKGKPKERREKETEFLKALFTVPLKTSVLRKSVKGTVKTSENF